MVCRILKSNECVITESFANHQKRVKGKQHIFGVDIVSAGYTTSYVVAHSDGKVVKVIDYIKGHELDKQGMGFGNQVIVQHDDNYCTIYSHLAYTSIKNKVGELVKQGQEIGYMGNTGSSTGAHTDFSVIKLKNGVDINSVNLVTDIGIKFDYLNPELYLNADLPIVKKEDVIYRVQVKSFIIKTNAIKFAISLRNLGFSVCIKKYGIYYRVQVGAFKNRAYAEAMLEKVRKVDGCNDAYITTESGVDVAF